MGPHTDSEIRQLRLSIESLEKTLLDRLDNITVALGNAAVTISDAVKVAGWGGS